ncbi:MAG: iron ABC transporter permease [Actinobacteria bacterium]|nr:iron ABC transporter permease [Propionicimonas sp.]MBU3975570.1 iron ABC transporter permease [Actinomycetota bacterium]MBU3986281.1 iron ABC transporter permease [Actinomycetota bacterium]MBU4007850.1 iron ABC transporter permease [Actinomycetota bacterium]MBU4064108.1 iron ABC transporter permease [Actinomycetota bacterium]
MDQGLDGGGHRVNQRGRGWVWAAVAVVPLSFLAVFFVWPVAALVARGFFDANGFNLSGVSEVMLAPRTWRIVGQTLAQAVVATIVAVVLGVPGAYLLYRCRFPGRRLLRAVVAVPFVLPSVVVGVAFRSMLAETGPLGFLGLGESFVAVVAALVFFNYAVVVRTVGVLWSRLDRRIAEAARSLGASRTRVWWTVTLPALAPAIASSAALTFLFCASAFGVVLILGGASWGTIETEIWYQTTQLLDLPAAAALSILQLVVVAASLLAADLTRARQERALKLAGSPVEHRLRRGDTPAAVLTAVVVLVGLVAPMATLMWRSLQTASGVGLGNYVALGVADGLPSVWQATLNSLATASMASAIALVLGVMVSYLLSRRPTSATGRRVLRLADAAFMLPLGVSAVTVGFGFLITLNRPPLDLRSSWLLIPIAQAIVALPLVVRSLLPTLRAIDPRLHQAAATLGATPARLVATIDAPLAWRGFGLAVGFAFATSLGEFGATTFLARPDRPTLPVEIFRLISRPGVENLGMAMAASVVLAVLTASVMAAAESIGPKEVTPW